MILPLYRNKFITIPIVFFSVIVVIEIILILFLNSGLFVYTTDDAYIHLALAENILKGHYGVNLFENSSPSSSILWPFLLAPFTGSDLGRIIPLLINTLASAGSIYVYFLIVKRIFIKDIQNNSLLTKFSLLLILALVVGTNLIGSLFSGMEHSLQIFLTVAIVYNILAFLQGKKVSVWFLAVIVIAPLIRYENLALSFSVLIFLFITGYRKKVIPVFLLIILIVLVFSFFLISIGLKPFPLSVLQKSSVVSTGSIYSLVENFIGNMLNPRGGLLFIGAIVLIYFFLSKKFIKVERSLAGCLTIAIMLHLFFGKDGRYIVYLWTAAVFIFLFFYRESILKFIEKNSFLKSATIVLILTFVTSYNYILNVLAVPIASNNIYEQQYQMHRFITEYYKKPVAVNDLGYVAFNNDSYVLDLVGLASEEALFYQRTRNTSEWIDTLCRKHNVQLAMIYEDWFSIIPESWIKIAELQLGKIKMGASRKVVSFYIYNRENQNKLFFLLKKFKKTLPEGVKLKLINSG